MLAELCRRSCKIFWSPGSNHVLRRLQQFLDKWTKMHVVMSQRWTPNVRVGHGSSGSSRAICASVACTRLGRHDPEECSSCSPSPMAMAPGTRRVNIKKKHKIINRRFLAQELLNLFRNHWPTLFLRCSPCMRASPSSWSRDRINLPPTKSVPRRAKILQRSACASASWPLQLGKAAVEVRKVPSLEITLRSSGKTATWTNAAGIMFAPQGENIVTLWVKQ